MNFVPITQDLIQSYLNDPDTSVLPNLYQGNNKFHLYKNNRSTIALRDNNNKYIIRPVELHIVD